MSRACFSLPADLEWNADCLVVSRSWQMRFSKRSYLGWGIALAAATAAVMGSGPTVRKQTLAPQERNASDGPPPIIRETPALPNSSNFDSAEEPHLRAVVVAKGLQQPWSVAFL